MNNFSAFYGVLYECPAGNRLADCPIYGMDHISFKEKIEWFENLSDAEKSTIVCYHILCSPKNIFY
jgi:hypothetical protein